jgi:hypothetical protein
MELWRRTPITVPIAWMKGIRGAVQKIFIFKYITYSSNSPT